jgi:hypothetical protein
VVVIMAEVVASLAFVVASSFFSVAVEQPDSVSAAAAARPTALRTVRLTVIMVGSPLSLRWFRPSRPHTVFDTRTAADGSL